MKWLLVVLLFKSEVPYPRVGLGFLPTEEACEAAVDYITAYYDKASGGEITVRATCVQESEVPDLDPNEFKEELGERI